VAEAIDAGCSGYVTKDRAVWELVNAVRLVQSGDTYLSPDVLAGLMLRMEERREGTVQILSEQEHDILQTHVDGCVRQVIARQLSLSLGALSKKDVRSALVKFGPVQPIAVRRTGPAFARSLPSRPTARSGRSRRASHGAPSPPTAMIGQRESKRNGDTAHRDPKEQEHELSACPSFPLRATYEVAIENKRDGADLTKTCLGSP